MNDSVLCIPSDAQHWPRDFDIRAEYAEQQELLDDATNRTPDNDNSGDATHD